MRTLSKEELQEILEKHKKWLTGKDGGERADLRGTDLSWANLREADLRGTDLSWANLRRADLRRADLRGTDLRGTDLREADLNFPIACPESGSFIGYKKARKYIIKLKILENAKRSSATSRKCRCDKAEVVAIENMDGTVVGVDSVRSNRDSSFIYRIGEIVSVDNFDDNRWNECTAGIHFFITRDEAVNYNM